MAARKGLLGATDVVPLRSLQFPRARAGDYPRPEVSEFGLRMLQKITKNGIDKTDKENKKLIGQSVSYFSLSVCPRCGSAIVGVSPA